MYFFFFFLRPVDDDVGWEGEKGGSFKAPSRWGLKLATEIFSRH